MRRFFSVRGSTSATPACHWGSIHGPGRAARAVVWICEYPYRTIKPGGPDRHCDGCPIWADIERARACPSRVGATQVEELHAMLAQ